MLGYVDLDLDNIRNTIHNKKSPFPHQMEAFEKLTKTFSIPITGYKGSLLFIPTGGGKTFTAINWICNNILSQNIKVLWLAQSTYLLDQAKQSFLQESYNIIQTKKNLKIRTISSSSSHSNSGSIENSDDIIITTTQTAISNILTETVNFDGEAFKFKLNKWIENCSKNELFLIIDEAHHTPAYGCRTLIQYLKNTIPNLYILGLTATPTHNDKRIKGWLEKIFDQGVCYRADISLLYKTNILAKPVYIDQLAKVKTFLIKLFDKFEKAHYKEVLKCR